MMQPCTEVLTFPSEPPQWNSGGEKRRSEVRPSDQSDKLKVVVVDDEATIANTLVEILADEGYDARTAYTGEDAVELAASFRPDILISDVVIPGMNGVDAAVKIREILPRCLIILFSGQAATVDLLKKARERGHEFEILAKPIKPENLLAVIRRKNSNTS
jgi:DNA-binding response OmpR family regulator